MLLGYGNQINPKGAASDYLQGNISPGFWQTAGSSYESGFISPFVAKTELSSYISGQQPDQSDKNLLETSKAFNIVAASGNPVTSFFGSTIGLATNPLTAIAGEGAGAAVSRGAEGLLDATAPGIASKVIASNPAKPVLNVGRAAGHLSKGAAIGATFTLPASIDNNYNSSTTALNWAGVAKDVAIGSAVGMGLSALPVAYGLLRYRNAMDMPITPEEEAFSNKNLGDHVSKDLETNQKTMQQAQDIVNKYVDNDHITVDQGYVNAKLMEHADIKGAQSMIADMLTSKGELDPEQISHALTPGLRTLLSDDQVMGGLKEAKTHLDMLHTDVENNLYDTLQKRLSKIYPTFKQVFKLGDEVKPEDIDRDKLQQLLTTKRSKTQQLLNVMKDPKRFGPRTVQHAEEIQQAFDTIGKLDQYGKTLQTIDVLSQLKGQVADDGKVISQTQDYLNGRIADSAPFPKIAQEENNTTATQQKVERKVVSKPEESVDENALTGEAKGMRDAFKNTKRAIETLKNSGDALDKLISCISGK